MNEYQTFKVENQTFKIKLGTFKWVVLAKIEDQWEIIRKSKTYRSARDAKYYYEINCMKPETLVVNIEDLNSIGKNGKTLLVDLAVFN
jgi:hypothetical protein